jgi:uncharacterized protein (TIGR04255 family)
MFGFPNAQRGENFHYKNNFLKSVIFQVRYPNKDIVLKNKDKIIESLIENYPNKHDLVENKIELHFQNKTQVVKNVELKPQGLNFTTKDGNKGVAISEDSITYTVNGLNYINFEHFFNEIKPELNKLFQICEISILLRVAIRKINLLEFTINEDIRPADALGIIFNHSLISNSLSIPGRNLLEKSITNFSFSEGNFKLNLSYGLLPKDINKNQNAILDIDLFSTQEGMSINELYNQTMIINKEIFNIFSWTLLESTKNQLDHGN